MAAGGSGLPCHPARKKSSGESFPSLLLGSPLDAFDRERRGRRNTDNALHCDTERATLAGSGACFASICRLPTSTRCPECFCRRMMRDLCHFLRQILSVDSWTTCCCEISKLICRTTWILLFSNLFFRLGAPLLAHSLSAFKEMYYWKNLYRYICVYSELYTSFNRQQNGNKSSSNL